MNRPLRAACILASLGCTALPGWAQSSNVSLSGVLDLYVGRAEAGSQRWWRMEDGGHTASRLMVRASEDLGGGLRASMLIEGGFNADTGAGTIPGPAFGWTRQSFVGVSGPWGSVDLGRMYTPMFYTLFRADPFGVNAVFSPLNLVSATDGQTGITAFAARSSNMVRWRAPAGEGLIADLAYAPGEAAGSRSGDFMGATVGWQTPRWYLAYGLQKARAGSAAAPVPAPPTSTYQAISAAWKLPAVQVYGHAIRTSNSQSTVPSATLLAFGVGVPVGSVTHLMAMFTQREVQGSDRKQLALSLGADYSLSKRTVLYARVLGLDNRGGAAASLAQVPLATAGTDVRVYAVGMRHGF